VTGEERALADLLGRLAALDYDFVTVTPETHRRVVARRDEALDLRDVFGWSLPFRPNVLPADILALLTRGGGIEKAGELSKSRFRVARIGARLFLHSAYPTEAKDSVFFGPDTYRFVRFLRAELAGGGVRHLVDMGAGCGGGALSVADMLPDARLTLVDANPAALRLARINAAAAGISIEILAAESLDAVPDPFDLLVANPPYIRDEKGRDYRDGGGMLGARLSFDWTLAAARRLPAGGRMLLYTGSAIRGGKDALRAALAEALAAASIMRRSTPTCSARSSTSRPIARSSASPR
jgi:hypothetical protein